MATELGKAFVQIVPSAQGIGGSISNILGNEAETAGKKAGVSIAGGIGTALKTATGVVAAGATALTGALAAGAQSVASYGDNIDKMSQKMGISAQGYQEWDAVMQHSGTSMETMKSSMKTLANAVEKGNGAFERIGISMTDLSSMSNEDIFAATIAGLQNVDNETERTYLAGQLLGRGATELGALLNTSAEDTQAMRDRVRELGGVMSDDAVKAAAAFQDNMQDLQTAVSGLGRGMMAELLPSMNNIIAGFTNLIMGEQGATEKLSAGFEGLYASFDGVATKLASAFSTLIPQAIQDLASILPQILSLTLNILSSLFTSISKAFLTFDWIGLGISLIDALSGAIDSAAGSIMGSDTTVLDTFIQNLTNGGPQLLSKGVDLLIKISEGILKALPSLITTAGSLMTSISTTIMSSYPTILENGSRLVFSLVDGIVRNLPSIVQSVLKVIVTFVSTVGQNLPTILSQGIIIVGKLVAGLIQAIPQIVGAIPQLISAIVNGFGNFDWWSIGKDIVRGIANGLKDAAGIIKDAAKDAAKKAFEAAKDFLGIKSPATKGIYIGEMYDAGIAKGISQNRSLIDNAMNDLNRNSLSGIQSSASFNFEEDSGNDSKIDMLISLLQLYLPQIAQNEGVDVNQLFNGINRQLGWGLQ
ncbi:MAG: hypothetical protein IIZ78_00185 [Clostridiales bacterium]|nr:hypothetical protein [Clostridiales bacterium]